MTEINSAQNENRPLNIVGLPMNEFASNSLSMLWANIHFYCDDEEVVERCWPLTDGYLVRRIPLIITPQGEEFGNGTYQEAIVEFAPSGVISDFRFALDAQLGESMEMGGKGVVEIERRQKILSYCERFRTAYNTKDINFLNQIFSNDALIITGTVVKTKSSDMGIGGEKVLYKKQNKQQYLANLKRAFMRNKWIDVKFFQIGEKGETGGPDAITQSSVNPKMYGVRLRQEWRSSNYSDEGYLFLLWDFTNEDAPVIHVRTWQPEWVGGQKLPEDDIFSLSDFDL
ncbi:hypothetical protein I6E11_11570 [Bacteroides caecigallinarum]|nr:hypothetical protein [Bacteroides caecigallinarum]